MSVIACPTDALSNEHFVKQLQSSLQSLAANSASSLRLLPVGAMTKQGLIKGVQAERVDLRSFQGITAYDPSEFLITARAGTPIHSIATELAKHGQYLPFDPLFVQEGATLGGTIASGVSGPNRLLYGGLRDFVMEVALLDGHGQIVRGGGKVVKNAAGFDLPKMMVGSYGRMGIILDATLKVFPEPQGLAHVRISTDSINSAIQTMQTILAKPFPITGLDIDSRHQIALRVAGPCSSLAGVIERIALLCPRYPCVIEEQSVGQEVNRWLESGCDQDQLLVKIAQSPTELVKLDHLLQQLGCTYVHSCAGTVAWAAISISQLAQLDQELLRLGLSGIVVGGNSGQPFVGNCQWLKMATRIQAAIDPLHRFVEWN